MFTNTIHQGKKKDLFVFSFADQILIDPIARNRLCVSTIHMLDQHVPRSKPENNFKNAIRSTGMVVDHIIFAYILHSCFAITIFFM